MKFLLNSAIDTLPTKVNLKLWGKRASDKCRCGRRETLNHILNGCDLSLQEGRYTYRHDNILHCLDRVKRIFSGVVPGNSPATMFLLSAD